VYEDPGGMLGAPLEPRVEALCIERDLHGFGHGARAGDGADVEFRRARVLGMGKMGADLGSGWGVDGVG